MLDYILDYNDLHAEYEEEQERRTEKHPKCSCCGERILEDKFYNIEGTYICENCIEDFKVNTDEYLED